MSRARAILGAFLVFLFLFALTAERPFSTHFAYYYDILINIGINIILAVSLNLVNGYTGQFSLGHAGFMAVGAYVGVSLADHFVCGLNKFLSGSKCILSLFFNDFPIFLTLSLFT